MYCLGKNHPVCSPEHETSDRVNISVSKHREGWAYLLQQLATRNALAEAMGGEEKIARQHQRERLTARERIAQLCDQDSFNEYGALAGGNHPGGEAPLAGDGLVGGTARIDGRTVA